jgi:hypothetical protein
MWFDALESRYHTSSELGAFRFTEFASCLVTKAKGPPAPPESSA